MRLFDFVFSEDGARSIMNGPKAVSYTHLVKKMGIYLGLQGFQLVALVFYLGFIYLIDIQVEITEHVIEGDGDVNQLSLIHI